MTRETYIANVGFTFFVAVGLTIAIRVYDFVHSEEHITLKADVVEAYNPTGEQDLVPSITVTPSVIPTMAADTSTEAVGPVATRHTEGESKTVQEIIRDKFPDDVENIAIAVFTCESGLNPRSLNSSKIEHSVGPAQINLADNYGHGKKVHWAKSKGATLEEKVNWLMVPENNIEVAYQIWKHSGFNPWTMYKNGCYKKYL